MQTIMVTICHKLVWVQIQVDERERQRTLSEIVKKQHRFWLSGWRKWRLLSKTLWDSKYLLIENLRINHLPEEGLESCFHGKLRIAAPCSQAALKNSDEKAAPL